MSIFSQIKSKLTEAVNTVTNTLFPESPSKEAGKEIWETAKSLFRTVKSGLNFALSFIKSVVAGGKLGADAAMGGIHTIKAYRATDEAEAAANREAASQYSRQAWEDLKWVKDETSATLSNGGSTLYNAGASIIHAGETAWYGIINPSLYGAYYLGQGATSALAGLGGAIVTDAVEAIEAKAADDIISAVEQLDSSDEVALQRGPSGTETKKSDNVVPFLPAFKSMSAKTATERLRSDLVKPDDLDAVVDQQRKATPAA